MQQGYLVVSIQLVYLTEKMYRYGRSWPPFLEIEGAFPYRCDHFFHLTNNMKKIVLLLSITIFGWVGWWVGIHLGGIMTAYLISMIGSLLGVLVGVRINQRFMN